MDLMLLKWAGKTCGLGFHPNLGFFCINDAIDESSPFGSNYMMASLGFMVIYFLSRCDFYFFNTIIYSLILNPR